MTGAAEEQAKDNPRALSFGYASFFWMYYSFQAVFTAYFPVYCISLGFTALQTAIITAAENFANLIGPPLATKYLYRRLSPRSVVVLGAVAVFLFYAPLVFVQSFFAVLLLYFLLFCANKSVITSANAAAVKAAESGGINYGRVRIWGSIGFVAATFVIGWLIDEVGTQAIVLVGLVICGLLVSVIIRQGKVFGTERLNNLNTRVSIMDVFVSPSLRSSLGLLLISVAFGWASYAVFFTYFSVYLSQLGWSGIAISTAWTVAVVGEIIVFYYFESIARRIPMLTIYIVSLWTTALRWAILAVSSSVEMIIFTQVLHSISFGAFFVATMKLLHRTAPQGFEERAMGYFSAIGPGLGLLLGRLAAGVFADTLGEGSLLQPLFWMAAGMAVVGALAGHKLVVPSQQAEGYDLAEGIPALACDHGECR